MWVTEMKLNRTLSVNNPSIVGATACPRPVTSSITREDPDYTDRIRP